MSHAAVTGLEKPVNGLRSASASTPLVRMRPTLVGCARDCSASRRAYARSCHGTNPTAFELMTSSTRSSPQPPAAARRHDSFRPIMVRPHASSLGIHALSEITCCSLGWTVLTKRSSRSRIHATAPSNSPDEESSPGNGHCTSRNEGPGRTSFIGLRVGFPDATPAWDSVARCSIPVYGRHPSEPGE